MLTRSSRDWCNHTPKQLPLLRPRLQLTVNLIDYRLSETERQVISFNMSWIIVPRKLASNRKFFNFTMLHTAWAFSCYFFSRTRLDSILKLRHDNPKTKTTQFFSYKKRCQTILLFVDAVQKLQCQYSKISVSFYKRTLIDLIVFFLTSLMHHPTRNCSTHKPQRECNILTTSRRVWGAILFIS